MIRIGCCSFIFGKLGLEESLELCRVMGFRHVDVSAADIGPKAHVDQQEVAADPEGQARRVRELAEQNGLELEEVFLCPVFVDGKRVEVSHPDAGVRSTLLENFRKLCAFTASAGFKSIMAVPGTPQEGVTDERAWENATETLREMVKITSDHGIRLSTEPHNGSLIHQPEAALRMAEEVPSLTYTLDYAHYIPKGIVQEDAYPLHAYAGHMHARQANPDSGGCALEEGTIDFGGIIRDLNERQWDGVIAMEFFGGVDDKTWKEHAVIQNVALAQQLSALAEG
ncbi:sugar phosphate isomerase/epimerase family protein [Verrucomicrobiota bacterium]